MDGTNSTNTRDEKTVQNSGQKTWRDETTQKTKV